MRDIDHDPQPVAAANDLGPGIGQAAVHRRLGLDVAQFVHAIMGELQMAERPFVMRFVNPIDLAFQKVRALGGDDGRRRARPGGSQPGGILDHHQPLIARHAVHARERQLAILVQFAGRRLAVGMNASIGHDPVGRSVGHHREADRRQSALSHRLPDRAEKAGGHPALAGDTAGVTVDIHGRRRLDRAPRVSLPLHRRGRCVSRRAGRETHQRTRDEHAAPGHRPPSRRVQQPRAMQLVAPAGRIVALNAPGPAEPHRLAPRRYGGRREDFHRRRPIARHASWAAPRLERQHEPGGAGGGRQRGREALDLHRLTVRGFGARRSQVPPGESHASSPPRRCFPGRG